MLIWFTPNKQQRREFESCLFSSVNTAWFYNCQSFKPCSFIKVIIIFFDYLWMESIRQKNAAFLKLLPHRSVSRLYVLLVSVSKRSRDAKTIHLFSMKKKKKKKQAERGVAVRVVLFVTTWSNSLKPSSSSFSRHRCPTPRPSSNILRANIPSQQCLPSWWTFRHEELLSRGAEPG